MPTMQVFRWFAGSLLVAGLGLGGCSGPPACRRGTLQVSLTYDATAVQADTLSATLTVPAGSTTFPPKSHFPGTSSQVIIFDLNVPDAGPGYSAGTSYTLEVLAKRLGVTGTTIAFGTAQGTLSASCTLQSVNLSAGTPPDMVVTPPPDLTTPPDQTPTVDLSATDQ